MDYTYILFSITHNARSYLNVYPNPTAFLALKLLSQSQSFRIFNKLWNIRLDYIDVKSTLFVALRTWIKLMQLISWCYLLLLLLFIRYSTHTQSLSLYAQHFCTFCFSIIAFLSSFLVSLYDVLTYL